MGHLSCNAESAIATCDSYNFELLTKKPRTKRPFHIAEFTFSDLHSATNGFSSANLLGKGSHGSVYKAYLRRIKLVAAVKKTKQTRSTADNEMEILSKIYHPRLVNLLGFAVDANQHKLIVVEYMPNGSLYDLLHGSVKPPGWVKRTRFALQVARAVQFLHTSHPPIIHRDIKSSNVLIDSKFNSRVSDFGLALRGHVEDVKVRSTPPAGTLGYLDPSYLAPGDLSTKSDVFSFGTLLLEIISGRNAIDVNYSPPSVVEWALPEIKAGNFTAICDQRIGPLEDYEALRRMAALAARCVRSTAEQRPEMSDVLDCLKSVYKRMKMQSQVCMNLRRRVAEGSRVAKYEPLDYIVEVGTNSGTRKDGKLSGTTSLGMRSDMNGDCVGRSKSMGTAGEVKFVPMGFSCNDNIDRNWVGFSVKMSTVRLSKSKSTGILVNSSNRSVGIGIGTIKLEESKLLVELVESNVKSDDNDN